MISDCVKETHVLIFEVDCLTMHLLYNLKRKSPFEGGRSKKHNKSLSRERGAFYTSYKLSGVQRKFRVESDLT